VEPPVPPEPAGTGPLYPVNLRLTGRKVLVVGGGRVAVQKVGELVRCGAAVTVVAPAVVDELRADERVTCEVRPYRLGEAAAYRFVVAATDDPAVNQVVHDDCEAAGIWVNAADDPARCTVTLPSRVRRGSVLVTVSTEGRSPALAAWLRQEIDRSLGPEVEDLLEVLAGERDRLRAEGRRTEGLDWMGALEGGVVGLVRAGDLDGARALLRARLDAGPPAAPR
jgi:precorrin-2 dehydrogenase/sirohydrochlorin ferrochelatase